MTGYQPLFPLGEDKTEYRQLDVGGVSRENLGGRDFTVIKPEAISHLAETAFGDISHLFRKAHMEQLASILEDPEASANDRFVALELIKNANISAAMEYPSCQDTGTAIVSGKKGQYVLTEGDDGAALSEGVQRTWASRNLRYSQMAPLSMFEEKNTGSNLPAADRSGGRYRRCLQVPVRRQGWRIGNKTFLFQQTRRVLDPERLMVFFRDELPKLGTAACPPYHLAIVIGGMSAEQNLKTVKMASTKYYDELPTTGSESGHAFRDIALEQEVHKLTQSLGIGAQFGGKYFCHDVRIIRLPRHGASLPIGIGVSCSADRQAKGKITGDGVFMEELVRDPSVYLPTKQVSSAEAVKIDLNLPMDEIRNILTKLPVETPVSLSGTMVVARDIVHAELSKRVSEGGELPSYFKDHPIYYAGPAKTPEGRASGAFGPTTAARMDPYVPEFQAIGGSMVSIAKGNRSKQVVDSCKANGGFYLGSIGGGAARIGQDQITNVEVMDFEHLGMEAVWKIEVKDFPAFVVIDDKGNDFFDFNRKREADA